MEAQKREVREQKREARAQKRRKRGEHVLEKLECPICFGTMLPPIRQCNEGHNLCDRCCTRLLADSRPSNPPKCPTCRILLKKPVARARNLEDYAMEADIEVQCDMPGCEERFRYSSLSQHKQTCVARTVLCPLKRCGWRGEPSGLAAHLQHAQACVHHSLPITVSHRLSHRSQTRTAKCSLTFQSGRTFGDARRWRPQRQLIRVPAEPPSSRRQAETGSEEANFCLALWKEAGESAPFCASIQQLSPPSIGGVPQPAWSCKISLLPKRMAEPDSLELPTALHSCSFEAPVPRLDVRDVWLRPSAQACASGVMLVSARQMTCFNASDEDCNQLYKLDVVLSRPADETAAESENSSENSSESGDSDDYSDDDGDELSSGISSGLDEDDDGRSSSSS